MSARTNKSIARLLLFALSGVWFVAAAWVAVTAVGWAGIGVSVGRTQLPELLLAFVACGVLTAAVPPRGTLGAASAVLFGVAGLLAVWSAGDWEHDYRSFVRAGGLLALVVGVVFAQQAIAARAGQGQGRRE